MFMFALISGVAMLPAFAWEYSTGFVLQPTLLTFSADRLRDDLLDHRGVRVAGRAASS